MDGRDHDDWGGENAADIMLSIDAMECSRALTKPRRGQGKPKWRPGFSKHWRKPECCQQFIYKASWFHRLHKQKWHVRGTATPGACYEEAECHKA